MRSGRRRRKTSPEDVKNRNIQTCMKAVCMNLDTVVRESRVPGRVFGKKDKASESR